MKILIITFSRRGRLFLLQPAKPEEAANEVILFIF